MSGMMGDPMMGDPEAAAGEVPPAVVATPPQPLHIEKLPMHEMMRRARLRDEEGR